jgi:hypothetical protein
MPVDEAQTSLATALGLLSPAMDRATFVDASDAGILETPAQAPRAFNLSMLVSGIRCTLAYVVLPFVTPFIGLAPGVGPALGIPIGAVAVVANVVSLRRFWILRHPWRRPITVLHILVIAFLLYLIGADIVALVGSGSV